MSSLALHDALNPAPLHTSIVGSRVLLFEQADSTNSRALELEGDGVVVVAESQTAGRGRHGRVWQSEPGLGLWFSVGFEPEVEGLIFGGVLAVRDALGPFCRLTVKWPNDLLLGGKKVCGILVETRGSRSVVGIGLNVHHRRKDFPAWLQNSATSLELETGSRFDRRHLLRSILTALDHRVKALRSGRFEAVFGEWLEACSVRGRQVCWGEVAGVVDEVDRTGALIVKTPHGLCRIAFGEIVEVEKELHDVARDRRGKLAYGTGAV